MKSLQDVIVWRNQLRELGKTVVFTNGCFDVLHAGHVTYLTAARQLGDVLVVGLNSDESVRRLKGPQRPINVLEDRIVVLEALRCVDAVVVFEEDTPLALITELLPDVLVKGGDYTREAIVGADVVETNGGRTETIPLLPGRSTTAILAKGGSQAGC